MKISVLIPTYRRPRSLAECLQGLQRQTRPADEILIVTQHSDLETLDLLKQRFQGLVLKTVLASRGGQVSQLNEGLLVLTGQIVAITDDDTIPHPDWLQRIEARFLETPDLGGAGGRDIVHEEGRILSGPARLVGRVLWFGRVVGNHHICKRMDTNVDILKGANMSYRTSAIQGLQFDEELRGKGAQVCNDMAFSLAVKKRGWRLLFDPAIVVDHFPAARPTEEQRRSPSLEGIENHAFNYSLALRRHMAPGLRRTAAIEWMRWLGTRGIPGWARGMRSYLLRDWAGVERYKVTARARMSAGRSAP